MIDMLEKRGLVTTKKERGDLWVRVDEQVIESILRQLRIGVSLFLACMNVIGYDIPDDDLVAGALVLSQFVKETLKQKP